MLTDDEISAMTAEQRRSLILRLRTPAEEVLPGASALRRRRGLRTAVTIGASALLVPWTIYLGFTLPSRVVVDGWRTVWVGYDIVLIVMLALTGWLGWKRRLAAVLVSFGTGVLVLSDAWFDVFTASGPSDVWFALGSAAVIEVPVALLLMGASIRLLRLSVVRFLVLPAGTGFWRLPLVITDVVGPLADGHPGVGHPAVGPLASDGGRAGAGDRPPLADPPPAV